MQLPNLQLKEFRALAAKSAQLGSYQQLVKLVETVFSNIDMLKLSFREPTHNKHHEHEVAVDVRAVQEFYRDFPKVAKNSGAILASLDTLLAKLKGEQQVKALLKSNLQLRGLFIALLYPRFYEFENTFHLIRLAHVMHFVPPEMRKTLSQWLTEVATHQFLQIIEAVQTVLSVELLKLLPDSGEEDLEAVQHYILIYCRLLELFFKSNQLKKRVDYEAFQNAQLTEHFDPLTQVKMTMRKISKLNFVRFPFLFDLDYKNKLLEFESKLQQMINLQKGIHSLQSGFIPMPDSQGNYTIDSVLYLHFEIRRNNILDDSVTKLSQTKQSLKKPLKIAFLGEEGHDEGGVKKQYFQLVIKEIFNPNLAMFVPKNNGRYFWFNGDSLEAPIMFEFLGVLLGLSIYNSIQLDLHFPNVVYKKLLEDDHTPKIDYWKELADMQPEVYKGIKTILDSKDSLAGLDLYFNVQTQTFGMKKIHELKPGGSSIAVTHQNKHQYAILYAEWLLNKHVHQQFKSFKKGFYKVVTGSMIKVFFARELQRVICGQENLDFNALQKGTDYEGYTEASPIVKYLWQILHEMDLQQKKSFLFFVTGSDRAPIKGLGELGLLIQRQSPDTQNLPTAHTCTNVFLLPEYSSKAKLRQKLQLALRNNQGFGLI